MELYGSSPKSLIQEMLRIELYPKQYRRGLPQNHDFSHFVIF